MEQKQLISFLLTTLTTDKLFLFLGVPKLVKNAEQVLQVQLAKNFKNSGKQVRSKLKTDMARHIGREHVDLEDIGDNDTKDTIYHKLN